MFRSGSPRDGERGRGGGGGAFPLVRGRPPLPRAHPSLGGCICCGRLRSPVLRQPPLPLPSTRCFLAVAFVTVDTGPVAAAARAYLARGGRSCRGRPRPPVSRRPPLPGPQTRDDAAAAAVPAGAGTVALAARPNLARGGRSCRGRPRPLVPRRPRLPGPPTSGDAEAAAATAGASSVAAAARPHMAHAGFCCRRRPRPPVPRRPPLPGPPTIGDAAAPATTAGAGAVAAAARPHLACGGLGWRLRAFGWGEVAARRRRPLGPFVAERGTDLARAHIVPPLPPPPPSTERPGDCMACWDRLCAGRRRGNAVCGCGSQAARGVARGGYSSEGRVGVEAVASHGAWYERTEELHKKIKKPAQRGENTHVLLQPAVVELLEAPESHSKTRHKTQSPTILQHHTYGAWSRQQQTKQATQWAWVRSSTRPRPTRSKSAHPCAQSQQ